MLANAITHARARARANTVSHASIYYGQLQYIVENIHFYHYYFCFPEMHLGTTLYHHCVHSHL